jgi:hypothetical protein
MIKLISLFAIGFLLMITHSGMTQNSGYSIISKQQSKVTIDINFFSKPLSTDRGRLRIVEIPDVMGGEPLKVVRTDTNTPLRGASPWITRKQEQLSDISESFLKDQRDAHLNSIRLVWFQAWYQASEVKNSYTDFNNPDEVRHCLEMIEKYVDICSRLGMYCIINFHSAFGKEYDEKYATEMWTNVASYFRKRTHVAFETANEPCNDFNVWMGEKEMNKHVNIYNLMKKIAPETMQFVLTPNRLPDSYPTAEDLAARFSEMTSIDWNNTVVGYHLYAGNSNAMRNLHKKFPAFPTENNFPANSGAVKDPWGGVSMDGDYYSSQTCEKLGVGWFHWAITHNKTGYESWYTNWPILLKDAKEKGWYWDADTIN